MARTNNRLQNQGLWVGAGPGTENTTTLFLPGQLGQIYIALGKAYQFVQFKSTTSAITSGIPVCWSDFDDYVVSAEIDDVKRNYPAGFALGTQTAGSYGWIQVDGNLATAIIDGLTAAAGDVIQMSATDGQATRIAAGTAPTYIPMGIATATSGGAVSTLASGTVALRITVPHNGW